MFKITSCRYIHAYIDFEFQVNHSIYNHASRVYIAVPLYDISGDSNCDIKFWRAICGGAILRALSSEKWSQEKRVLLVCQRQYLSPQNSLKFYSLCITLRDRQKKRAEPVISQSFAEFHIFLNANTKIHVYEYARRLLIRFLFNDTLCNTVWITMITYDFRKGWKARTK